MEPRTTAAKRKLQFSTKSAIALTPLYRRLRFPLHRELVEEDGQGSPPALGHERASSTVLALPVTLGRRNLAHCWWVHCPRKCHAYKKSLIDDACDSCYLIRGVREKNRTALSLSMIEVDLNGNVRVVARHSKTIQIVDRSGARVRSLTQDNGTPRVLYLTVRDRRSVGEAKHSMNFCLQWKRFDSVGESQDSSPACLASRQPPNAASEGSHPESSARGRKLGREPSRRDKPRTLASSCMVTPRTDHIVASRSPGSRRPDPTESRTKFATPAPAPPPSPPERSPVETADGVPASRSQMGSRATRRLSETRSGLSSSSSGTWYLETSAKKQRVAGEFRALQRKLEFKAESPLEKPASLSTQESSPRRGSMDLLTQMDRPLAAIATRGSSSTIFLLPPPRSEALSLSMKETSQLPLPSPAESDRCKRPRTRQCCHLALDDWRRERDQAAPDSFRRAVMELIVHVNQQSQPPARSSLWLPSFVDSDCLLDSSAIDND